MLPIREYSFHRTPPGTGFRLLLYTKNLHSFELMCRLKEPAPLPSDIELAEGGTLKFTFTAIDTTSGSAIQPKQAHLLFEDLKGEEDVTLPVTIKENGKASFTIVRHFPVLRR
jgi:hypothetical protein